MTRNERIDGVTLLMIRSGAMDDMRVVDVVREAINLVDCSDANPAWRVVCGTIPRFWSDAILEFLASERKDHEGP